MFYKRGKVDMLGNLSARNFGKSYDKRGEIPRVHVACRDTSKSGPDLAFVALPRTCRRVAVACQNWPRSGPDLACLLGDSEPIMNLKSNTIFKSQLFI